MFPRLIQWGKCKYFSKTNKRKSTQHADLIWFFSLINNIWDFYHHTSASPTSVLLFFVFFFKSFANLRLESIPDGSNFTHSSMKRISRAADDRCLPGPPPSSARSLTLLNPPPPQTRRHLRAALHGKPLWQIRAGWRRRRAAGWQRAASSSLFTCSCRPRLSVPYPETAYFMLRCFHMPKTKKTPLQSLFSLRPLAQRESSPSSFLWFWFFPACSLEITFTYNHNAHIFTVTGVTFLYYYPIPAPATAWWWVSAHTSVKPHHFSRHPPPQGNIVQWSRASFTGSLSWPTC